jgi:hypothetical protein
MKTRSGLVSAGAALTLFVMLTWPATVFAATSRWIERETVHVKVGADEVVAPLACETPSEVLQVGWTILVACGKQGVALYDLSRGLELVSRTDTPAPCVVFGVEGNRVTCFASNGAKATAIDDLIKERRGTTYATRNGALFATNATETPLAVGCALVSGSVRVGPKLYLACGAGGLAVYDVSGTAPTLSLRVEGPCARIKTSGVDVTCGSLDSVEIAPPSTWDATTRLSTRKRKNVVFAPASLPEEERQSLTWVAPVVILGVGTVVAFVVTMVAVGASSAHGSGGLPGR